LLSDFADVETPDRVEASIENQTLYGRLRVAQCELMLRFMTIDINLRRVYTSSENPFQAPRAAIRISTTKDSVENIYGGYLWKFLN